jgi:hypothetical protein
VQRAPRQPLHAEYPLQPWHFFLPNSAASPLPVRAIINTTLYIALHLLENKRKPTHAISGNL